MKNTTQQRWVRARVATLAVVALGASLAGGCGGGYDLRKKQTLGVRDALTDVATQRQAWETADCEADPGCLDAVALKYRDVDAMILGWQVLLADQDYRDSPESDELYAVILEALEVEDDRPGEHDDADPDGTPAA